MTNEASARDILEYARSYALRNMKAAQEAGVANGVVRAAQETAELVLKAAIRQLGADYPKVHDAAPALVVAAAAAGVGLPPEDARRLLEESRWLAQNRGPAFYHERAYQPHEAHRAAQAAEWIVDLVERVAFRPARGGG
jgi:HEPN domain-containing protein